MAFKNSYYMVLGVFLLYGGVRAFGLTHDEKILALYPQYNASSFNRTFFPAAFTFGAASSAYQYEGAVNEDGRGQTNWDKFTRQFPEKIIDGSNGDVANDQYHRYKEDVALMKKMGLDIYRFSIAWSRILPNGTLSGGINKKGVEHYNNLINELLRNGIKPAVTIFNRDLPQALDDEYGGFLSTRILKDFADYAEVCFREFGDRVIHWVTINEPYKYAFNGYGYGNQPPGRCSDWLQLNCTGGDSSIEPYTVAHNLLLAHATVGRIYKRKYKPIQKGEIGISHVASWTIPYSNSTADVAAAQRNTDFFTGWFLDPMVYGEYPTSMRKILGKRLPYFTRKQIAMLKGSYDFIGVNYYTTYYGQDSPEYRNSRLLSIMTDPQLNSSGWRNGAPIGHTSGSPWLLVYPPGIREILVYIKNKYNNPVIVVTENGVNEANNTTLPLRQQLADPLRISYHYDHLQYVRKAIVEDGVKVWGYFAYSFLDAYEWSLDGYTVRFGLNYVDFKNGLKRYPKHSAIWFKSFLKKGN